MRIHVIQHASFEGIGSIASWAQKKNVELTFTRQWLNETLPALREIDGLIVMGGPMGVHDEKEFPWLKDEKAFIKATAAANIPVLGICLGSQLLADVLGGKVFKGPEPEIGFFPVEWKPAATDFGFPKTPSGETVFFWHGDAFELPPKAIHLAGTPGCANQAFVLGSCLALLFHLEMDAATMEALIVHSANDLQKKGRYIQDVATMRRHSQAHLTVGPKILDGILTKHFRKP